MALWRDIVSGAPGGWWTPARAAEAQEVFLKLHTFQGHGENEGVAMVEKAAEELNSAMASKHGASVLTKDPVAWARVAGHRSRG